MPWSPELQDIIEEEKHESHYEENLLISHNMREKLLETYYPDIGDSIDEVVFSVPEVIEKTIVLKESLDLLDEESDYWLKAVKEISSDAVNTADAQGKIAVYEIIDTDAKANNEFIRIVANPHTGLVDLVTDADSKYTIIKMEYKETEPRYNILQEDAYTIMDDWESFADLDKALT